MRRREIHDAQARAIYKRSESARKGWETRRAHINELLNTVEELAEYARATAEGLRTWWVNRDGAGAGMAGLHPLRVANRLDLLAERLKSTKGKHDE